MKNFPTYDPEADTLQLNGAAALLLGIILKAKFGEKFDPDVLLNEPLAGLASQIAVVARPDIAGRAIHFSHEDRWSISKTVFDESGHIGWWSMQAEERAAYLQQVAAPYVMHDDQVEQVIDDIEGLLSNAQQVVDASKRASTLHSADDV
ncbi:MAG: hypothetical protein H6918_00040 [Sphingomonadaceae bacterium]|nr:hypothetical protein [Sphingomonadaceae bacterium]